MLGIKNYLVDIYDLSNIDYERLEKLEKFPLSDFINETVFTVISLESLFFSIEKNMGSYK